MYPIAVMASGRGSNLEAMIQAWQAGQLGAEIALVISDNPKAQALERAAKYGIPYQVIDPTTCPNRDAFDAALIECIQQYQIRLIALAGYMRLISARVLQAFPHQIINIHPSLLPAFPGLNAQEQAWQYGVKYSGCTVHFVDEGMDTGPIIAQRVVPVLPGDTVDDLTDRILKEEHQLYPQVIRWFAEGRVVLQGRKVLIKGE